MARLSSAQTNLQLFAVLRQTGQSTVEIACVRAAYELAMLIFAGCYRGSGKPFLAHAVGTASILASVNARAPVVAAGLLHAAYSHGEFGDGWRGPTPARRDRLRDAVGAEVEELVARYTAFIWNAATIAAINDRRESLEPLEKEVLLMRLANELDDHLDLGVLYCANAEQRREHVRSCLLPCVDVAKHLGFHGLSDALNEAFQETLSADVPAVLRRATSASFVVAPKSHRLRLSVMLRRLLARLYGR